MIAKHIFLTSCLAFVTGRSIAQTYSMDWSSITSGGGTLTHGGYAMDGSIDVNASSPATSSAYGLQGGFISGSQAPVSSRWVLRATNGPPPRYAPAMAFDTVRGVTVLYSGGQAVPNIGYVGLGEVWEWNGSQWKQRTTYNSDDAWHQDIQGYWVPNYGDTPPARLQHAMAYDSRRGRIVMFGGRGAGPVGGDYMFGDTWEWDGLRWYFRATNGPPARFNHCMAYDEGRGVTIVFGGFGASAAQVWEWDGNQWSSASPTNGPLANYSQDSGAMDYDPFLRQTFFGPATDGFGLRFFFSWDGQQWTSRGIGFSDAIYPPPQGSMIFDTYRQRHFFFGGLNNGFYGGSSSASYTSRQNWFEITDAGQTSTFTAQDFVDPSGFAATLSAQADPVAVFLWNQFSNSTQQVLADASSTPDQISGALVPVLNAILRGTSIYESNRFAGVSLSTETLIFQALNPFGVDQIRFNRLLLEDAYPAALRKSPSTPTGRYYHAMAYDSTRHAAVLFGGTYNFPTLVGNETWELTTPDELLIEQQPLSQSRQVGDNALFTVAVRNRGAGGVSYQWFFNHQALTDNSRISGSHSPLLQVNALTRNDEGEYFVHVSDNLGAVNSLPARLSLDPGLQIFKIRTFSLVWGPTNGVLSHSQSLSPGSWRVVQGASSPFDVSGFGDGDFFKLDAPP